jgi:hypothetical protein
MTFKEQLYGRLSSDTRAATPRVEAIIEVVGEFGNFSFQITDSLLLLIPLFQHFFCNVQCSQYSHRQWRLFGYFFVNPVEHRVHVRSDLLREVFVFSTEWVIRAEDLDFDAFAGHTVCRHYVRKLVRRYVNQIALTVIPFQRDPLQARIELRNQLFDLRLQLFLLLF